jgi:hypothetical protein
MLTYHVSGETITRCNKSIKKIYRTFSFINFITFCYYDHYTLYITHFNYASDGSQTSLQYKNKKCYKISNKNLLGSIKLLSNFQVNCGNEHSAGVFHFFYACSLYIFLLVLETFIVQLLSVFPYPVNRGVYSHD